MVTLCMREFLLAGNPTRIAPPLELQDRQPRVSHASGEVERFVALSALRLNKVLRELSELAF
jgi:hypothetical protein